MPPATLTWRASGPPGRGPTALGLVGVGVNFRGEKKKRRETRICCHNVHTSWVICLEPVEWVEPRGGTDRWADDD